MTQGVMSVLVGHPLDLVKVRMQTAKDKDGKKQGTFQILRQILEKEGIGGIYRGVGEFSSEVVRLLVSLFPT